MKSPGIIKKGNNEAKSGLRKRKQSSLFRAQKKAKPRPKQSWDQTCLELKEYRKQHGHCHPVRGGPDDFLSQWAEKQRRNKQKLKSDQVRRLNEFNFDWRTRQEREDNQWNTQLEKVKAYKQQYSDTQVPANYTADPSLGGWVATQRDLYKKHRLRPDRLEKLEEIGFLWSIKKSSAETRNTHHADAIWKEMYDRLKEFRDAVGHCIVPRSYPDQSLQNWVLNQRRQYRLDSIRPERKKLLDEIDFVWRVDVYDAKSSLHQQHFDNMFGRLVAFKNTHGHTQVPFRYPEDPQLAQWVFCQRKSHHALQLEAKRKQRLDDIGFWWGQDPAAGDWGLNNYKKKEHRATQAK